MSTPVAARSKAWVCGCSLAMNAGSNPTGVWMSVSDGCFVFSGRYLCYGPISRPEESYGVFVSLSVIKEPHRGRPRPTRAVEL